MAEEQTTGQDFGMPPLSAPTALRGSFGDVILGGVHMVALIIDSATGRAVYLLPGADAMTWADNLMAAGKRAAGPHLLLPDLAPPPRPGTQAHPAK